MKSVINELVRNFVAQLMEEIQSHILKVIEEKGTKLSVGKVSRTPRSDEQMRCRYTANGHQCKNRSRGPRFLFLCEEHSDKKPTAKKPVDKKVEAKKPVAKKVEAKKPVAKKVEAKKPAPKKVEAKKPETKKPAPKKVEAKKPEAKKPVVAKPVNSTPPKPVEIPPEVAQV